MLKALTGLLIAGAASLAIASPAAATPVCTDGVPEEIWGPGEDGYVAYFDVNDYCTGDQLEIYTIDWSGYWYDYGHYGVIDSIYSPVNILVTVYDGSGFDTFYLIVDPYA
jgi:hypothetical protein